VNKQTQNVASNLEKAMRLEGTSKAPRKFTLGEIAERVGQVFLLQPNEEMETMVLELVIEGLRKEGRIKKEKSDYNDAQTILSYRILSNIDENGLIASLVKNGKYSITLTPEEYQEFVKYVVTPKENEQEGNKALYSFKKGDTNDTCTFSPNYGTKK